MTVEPVRIGLLGPMRAWRGETELTLGPPRQRAVLAALAVRAGRLVSREELIDAVWGENAPASAEAALYSYVSKLRRVLEPGRDRWAAARLLVSIGSGYCLQLSAGQLDLAEFERLIELAWRSAEDPVSAIAALDSALALWQGDALSTDALSTVDAPFVVHQRRRLDELRLVVVERRAELHLELGQPAAAVAALSELVARHPLRETPRGLLMRALHASGRTVEAMEVFRATETALSEELGIEPGPGLRAVRDELAATLPPLTGPSLPAPSPPAVFAGRTAELAELEGAVSALAGGAGGVVWVEGETGVGKTALLSAALSGVENRGCRMLWNTAEELGRNFPFALLRACVNSLASGLWNPDAPVEVTVEKVVAFIEQLCMDGPVVLAVDDLHWVDDASLLVWCRLVEVTRHRPLLLVGASRPAAGYPAMRRRRAEALEAGGPVLELAPLTENEVGELAGEWFGERLPLELLRCADGHPGYLAELAEAIKSADEARVRAVIVRRLPEGTAETLRWAALLGGRFDLGELAALTGSRPTELLPGIIAALRSGVLREAGEQFAFRHRLVREAIREDVPRAARTALHRQALEMMKEQHRERDRQAGQLLAVGVPMDRWITWWLTANSGRGVAKTPRQAADLLARALRNRAVTGDARQILAERRAQLHRPRTSMIVLDREVRRL